MLADFRTSMVRRLLCAALLLPPAVLGDSVVNGTVSDTITGEGIIGAQIDVVRSGVSIGAANSELRGAYAVPFPVSESTRDSAVTLKVNHHQYVPKTVLVQVQDGQPVSGTHTIKLLPSDVTSCINQEQHTIVVGRFRSPLGQQLDNLPERVRDALRYNLNHRLQTVDTLQVRPNLQYCGSAADKWQNYAKKLARFLSAHAYIFGEVMQGSPPYYKVRTLVSDAYELFDQPHPIDNDNVDLAEVASAIMNHETYAAILGSLAAGLAEQDDCESAITVINVVENDIAGRQEFAYLSAIKLKCRPQLPHNGLLLEDG